MQSERAVMPVESEVRANLGSAPRLEVPERVRSPKGQRIPALDFTKGALVLLMVLYHWLNYFIGVQWPYYKYLRFLTPSFIFITGFMISNVYLSKYAAADPRLPKRLFTRGLKLVAIFLALNVARVFVVPSLGTGAVASNLLDPKNLFAVFVSGNFPAGSKLISFSILVPISYLLMLSGILMLPYRFCRYTFHVVCAVSLLGIVILGMTGSGSYWLEFITIGLLGVLGGFVPIGAINDFVRHPYMLAIAYVGYVIAITMWNVPFSLLVVGTALSLTVIYLIGGSGSESGRMTGEIILLGKYSLFGYISQIGILQILSVGFHRISLDFAVLVVSFIAGLALTVVSVEMMDRARARAASVDKLYKLVFA